MTRWLSLSHAAEHLDITIDSLRRLVRQGIIPRPHNREGQKLWSEKELDAIFVGQPPTFKPKPSGILLPNKPPATTLLSIKAILEAASELPTVASGIYFLIKDRQIVYVGQSRHILRRMIDHMRARKFDAWHWVSCPPDELTKLENRYIKSLQPAWNKAPVP